MIKSLKITIAIFVSATLLFFAGKAESAKFEYLNRMEKGTVQKDEKSIVCSDRKVQRIRVAFGRITTLNFPVAPKEVLPGEVAFDFKQIRNDLNIKALSTHAKTNMVVYMPERRCSFELITVQNGGDDILVVRDPSDKQFEVSFQ